MDFYYYLWLVAASAIKGLKRKWYEAFMYFVMVFGAISIMKAFFDLYK